MSEKEYLALETCCVGVSTPETRGWDSCIADHLFQRPVVARSNTERNITVNLDLLDRFRHVVRVLHRMHCTIVVNPKSANNRLPMWISFLRVALWSAILNTSLAVLVKSLRKQLRTVLLLGFFGFFVV